MMEVIAPLAYRFITITPDSSRALSAQSLAAILESYCSNVLICKDGREAMEISINSCRDDEIICAFGSLYYVGDVRKYFGLR